MNNLWKESGKQFITRESSFISLIFKGFKEPIAGQSVCHFKNNSNVADRLVLLPESCWNDATATAHFHSWTGDRASQPPFINEYCKCKLSYA